MNRSHEHAVMLLGKARDDATMMRTLMDAPDSPDWGIGFHAQQAVEKAVKAVLSDRRVEFPRTHNLGELMELVHGAGLQGPPDGAELDILTPYGAPLRYESSVMEGDEPLDRLWAKDVVQRTLAWAESLMGVTGKQA